MIYIYAQFRYIRKGSGNCCSTTFYVQFHVLLYSINWPHFIVWLSLPLEILSNMCNLIVCLLGCDVINFEINLNLSNQAIFLHDQKVKTKNEISWERKELLRWNKKHFPSFLRGFQVLKRVSDLECASKEAVIYMFWRNAGHNKTTVM